MARKTAKGLTEEDNKKYWREKLNSELKAILNASKKPLKEKDKKKLGDRLLFIKRIDDVIDPKNKKTKNKKALLKKLLIIGFYIFFGAVVKDIFYYLRFLFFDFIR